MEKDRKLIWWTLFLLIASGIAILVGYYIGMDKIIEVEPPAPREEKKTRPPIKESPSVMKEIPVIKEKIRPLEESGIKEALPRLEEAPPPLIDTVTNNVKDECAAMKEELMDFFDYLDSRDYIKQSGENMDTFKIYKEILRRLSARLPVPSGEGLSAELMNSNIFHLFRIMDRMDIMIIKEVLINEKESIEINLEMFYSWFIKRDQCPEYQEIQPSWNLLYHYAGFFMNTIGGNAYLYRRSPVIRLLLSYYCVLIIHAADKQGANTYGIDIVPAIKSLVREMKLSPDLMFTSEYLDKLGMLQEYYIQKGRQ